MKLSGAVVAMLIAASPAVAEQTRSATAGSRPPAAQLSDLAWLEGTWVGEGFGAKLQETYTGPSGGQMVGHFSAIKDGAPEFYEFIMMAQVGNSLEYRVRHFNPEMTAWEDKTEFVRFPLVAAEKDSWYFDGYTLRRTGPDTAVHIVRIKRKDGTADEAMLPYCKLKD